MLALFRRAPDRFPFTLVRSFYLHEQFLSPASSTPKAAFARDFIQNSFRFSRSHFFGSAARTADTLSYQAKRVEKQAKHNDCNSCFLLSIN